MYRFRQRFRKRPLSISKTACCAESANKLCPVDAIDFAQQPETIEIEARAIILATGFGPTPADAKAEYGGGQFLNVVDALMMER